MRYFICCLYCNSGTGTLDTALHKHKTNYYDSYVLHIHVTVTKLLLRGFLAQIEIDTSVGETESAEVLTGGDQCDISQQGKRIIIITYLFLVL